MAKLHAMKFDTLTFVIFLGFKRRALRQLCLDVSLRALKTFTENPDIVLTAALVLGWSCVDDGK
jgi:hypothetical protein